jgi:hypothetical protein
MKRDLKFQDLRFEIVREPGGNEKEQSKKRCRDLSFADVVRPHPSSPPGRGRTFERSV